MCSANVAQQRGVARWLASAWARRCAVSRYRATSITPTLCASKSGCCSHHLRQLQARVQAAARQPGERAAPPRPHGLGHALQQDFLAALACQCLNGRDVHRVLGGSGGCRCHLQTVLHQAVVQPRVDARTCSTSLMPLAL